MPFVEGTLEIPSNHRSLPRAHVDGKSVQKTLKNGQMTSLAVLQVSDCHKNKATFRLSIILLFVSGLSRNCQDLSSSLKPARQYFRDYQRSDSSPVSATADIFLEIVGRADIDRHLLLISTVPFRPLTELR